MPLSGTVIAALPGVPGSGTPTVPNSLVQITPNHDRSAILACPRHRRRHGRAMLLASAIMVSAGIVPAAAKDDRPEWSSLERITPDPVVQGQFAGKKGKTAGDLSGIACRPAGQALDCLAINDEGNFAQRVKITESIIVPGETRALIGDKPPEDAVGTRPSIACPGGNGKFDEFDGEGVAVTGETFYVIGSHGCSRKKAEFRLSSFLLARLPAAADGAVGQPQLTWRLSDALTVASPVASFQGKSLMDQNGLNIEGIAVVGDRLYAGLRAPSLVGQAFIVSASVAALFLPDAPLQTEVRPVTLGKDTGIRDLTALPDGSLLILSGPAQEQAEVPFGLFLLTKDKVTPLGWLEDIGGGYERAKAEAVTVLSQAGNTLRLLVLFDGITNGGPREYRAHLPTTN